MANADWRREARVLEAAYDLGADDAGWAFRVLVELAGLFDRVAMADANASLHRMIPHLRTATALREAGTAVLRDEQGALALGREEVAGVWRDLLGGRLSRVALYREAGATHVLAVRSEPDADPRALTARELKIAVRCARGEANKSIALDLGVSPGAVSAMLGSAMEKLGLTSRAELVVWFGERHETTPSVS